MLSTQFEHLSTLFSTKCPHYGLCSGCSIPGIPRSPSDLRTGLLLGWRYRAKLAVGQGKTIGLFQADSHNVVPIPNCQAHHPAINQAVKDISLALQASDIPIYAETGRGLRYLQITVGTEIVLVATDPELVVPLFPALQRYSVWINVQKEATNTIFGKIWIPVAGAAYLTHRIGKVDLSLHPAAFLQAHLSLFSTLLEELDDWVPKEGKITELYAGAGAISLNLQNGRREFTLVESNPYAALTFPKMPGYEYLTLDASNAPIEGWVIVDPPRKGLPSSLVKKIASQGKGVTYISCNQVTFERDLKLFQELGWRLARKESFLFFPGTEHVEIVANIVK